ncbi:MAG: hypothetical protein K940chlam5_01529 [Candidatus Anoxychlamydiales bacterium]|nr:hypothetical protein [Candidatus Anoxychlamydiales bacterium]
MTLSRKLNGFLNYMKLPIEEAKDYPKEGKIVSVECFIIAPDQRRQGIARDILRFACSILKEKRYDIIETYPKKGLLPDAHSYH